ncbi:hypothetical protein Ddye_009682 [Dipteronia dyeriana]|uniref:Reverse transcriptase zinc-binding domain-containing protein n=1 Tax=Dipteronia dyeriana TaxID=168575 RepID=A0AAD9XC36_9ROSI|nr:hypothetical protein Ddye_009682 [Dipteronia dyeriana]
MFCLLKNLTGEIQRLCIRGDVQEILRIPLGTANIADAVLWHFDKRGFYTVKSGYCIGQELAGSPSVSNNITVGRWWLSLWKLDIPLKIKIFIWKASHEWIPTRGNLSKIGIQMDNRCPLCQTKTETTIHALWSFRKLKVTLGLAIEAFGMDGDNFWMEDFPQSVRRQVLAKLQ